MSEEGGSCKEENDEARGREAGWTRVQAVLLWASREDGTGRDTPPGPEGDEPALNTEPQLPITCK